MTTEEKYKIVEKIWDEYGFISETSKIESAEDPSIPFSMYDTKSTRTFKYKYRPFDKLIPGNGKFTQNSDGSVTYTENEYITYNRISNVFQWANEELEKWGYSCVGGNFDRNSLHKSYKWKSPDILYLNSITIENNFCRNNSFRISSLDNTTNYFEVKSKENIQKEIFNVISWMIKRKGDIKLMRELQLRELLK